MPLGLGCSARPGNARNNKTGSWRVFKPNFDRGKCTKCGMCRMVCPEGCIIETGDELFTPDYWYCKGCGLCARECPVDGITMEQEEK